MLTRRLSGFLVILLLACMSTLTFDMAVIVHADSELSAWAAASPTIDGVIDAAEWASAANVSYTTTGGVDGGFYVMNDGVNLYMAVVTPDATLSTDGAGTDAVIAYFDNDHDGVGPEVGDDVFGWTGYLSEGMRDGFSDGTYVWKRDTDFGGTSDGAAAAANNGTHNHFEMMHPLNTADDAHDFSLSMSDTVGFAIRFVIDGVDQGYWPSNDPSSWGDISIFKPILSAWTFNTPMIDGKLTPSYVLLDTPTPAEWEDADKIDFILSWGAESHNASLYVMNDYINLYLAFEIRNEEHDLDDFVVFNFDNDDDKVKETGDDVLYIDGHTWERLNLGGRFQDGFWPSPGAGPAQDDTSDGGDEDGVGASRFIGPKLNGSHIFEVAHPLNTNDDLHDFSLGVGDKVGFNVLYFDHGGGVGFEAGWPTFTQSDWIELANIEIAGPPAPPPPSSVNLRIDKIEITQAIQWLDDAPNVDNSLPLARGKSTVVRVYIDVGVWNSEQVDVYLYASESGWSLVSPGKYVPYGPLRQSFLAPPIPDRGNEAHTAVFLLPDYWVHGGHVTLVAFVKAPVGQSETDYTDNWMRRQTFNFTLTKSLSIGYYLIDYRPTAPDASPNLPSPSKVLDGSWFFEKVTPMPDLSDPVDYYPLGPPIVWDQSNFTDAAGEFNETAQEELLFYLAEIWLGMIDPPDQICGLYANAITRIGQAAGGLVPTSNVFVAHEDRPWSFAHEIGHNYGFPHSWQDTDNPWYGTPNANSTQTYGFDTQANWAPLEPGDLVKIPAVVVAGGKYGALMSYADTYRWVSPYTWKNLTEIFDPPSGLSVSRVGEAQSISRVTRVSGVIYRNNTGSLSPVFEEQPFHNFTLPSGPYTVQLRGPPPAEPLLFSQSFDASFESEACADGLSTLDRALFMLDLPLMTGAYSVSLWNNTLSPPVLLDQITASPTPPSVTVTYPNGGEAVGDGFTANWTATDLDGDSVTFKLFYSSDSGSTWRPLSPRIRETSYHVDTSVLPGGSQSLIRVVASDGFHTSEDQSDAVFSMPLKDPMNLVGNTIGPPERPVSFGEPIVLKGYAFDPEDGVLNGTALTWTSDLNGTLGTGRILPVTNLVPGAHNISLTATDSHGNNATFSFPVKVELHDIAVTDAALEKTVVGQGFAVNIDVTVENQGEGIETSNVTLYANTELAADWETITDVVGGSSVVVTFVWNTSLWAKGNYIIHMCVTPVLNELDMHDNFLTDDWIMVAMPCDVAGSTTTPPAPPDGRVDYKDLFWLLTAYGSDPSEPNWNPNLDFAGSATTPPAPPDNRVDYKDLYWMLTYYGQTDP